MEVQIHPFSLCPENSNETWNFSEISTVVGHTKPLLFVLVNKAGCSLSNMIFLSTKTRTFGLFTIKVSKLEMWVMIFLSSLRFLILFSRQLSMSSSTGGRSGGGSGFTFCKWVFGEIMRVPAPILLFYLYLNHRILFLCYSLALS